MFKRLAIALVCLLAMQSAYAQEDKKWICVADKGTGFRFEHGQWQMVNFNVIDHKFIVSKKKGLDGVVKYHATRVGKTYGTPCNDNKLNEYGYLFCRSIVEYRINTRALRYLSVYPVGYYDGEDNNKNTPNIVIGKCSPL